MNATSTPVAKHTPLVHEALTLAERLINDIRMCRDRDELWRRVGLRDDFSYVHQQTARALNDGSLHDALANLERAVDGFSRGEDFYVRDHGLALMLARAEARAALAKAEGR